MDNVTMEVQIPKDLYYKLLAKCDNSNFTKDEVIENLITDFVEEPE